MTRKVPETDARTRISVPWEWMLRAPHCFGARWCLTVLRTAVVATALARVASRRERRQAAPGAHGRMQRVAQRAALQPLCARPCSALPLIPAALSAQRLPQRLCCYCLWFASRDCESEATHARRRAPSGSLCQQVAERLVQASDQILRNPALSSAVVQLT